MILRDYQAACLDETRAKILEGNRSVCIVAPTGAGKSVLCTAAVKRHLANPRSTGVLIAVPRIELVTQMAGHLTKEFPPYEVGIIAPRHDPSPTSRIQVSTIQTLLARPTVRPPASLLILDECHHVVSDHWVTLAHDYPAAYTIGLTATPERQDGRPLGDLFTALVVAAPYSKLIQDGYLVPCNTYAPDEIVASGLAQDPLEAYRKLGNGQRMFAFCQSVQQAEDLAAQFSAAGIPSACITDKTPKAERADSLTQFKDGALRALFNVYCLTEGVDIPAAAVCMLACRVSHVGGYLQRVGRVLRPAAGKTEATLIDLVGNVHLHGLPTQDRNYHLDGKAITHEKMPSLRTCLQCGFVMEGRPEKCERCGFEFPIQTPEPLRIYSLELRRVYEGENTADQHKIKERDRLLKVARERGFGLYFVLKEYERLFNAKPDLSCVPDDEKRREWERLSNTAQAKNYKQGWASYQFKNLFGVWPRFTTPRPRPSQPEDQPHG